MKLYIPKKSFFGFKILNSKDSIIFAYILIFSQYLLVPQFGNKIHNQISGSLFLFICNTSILILTFNSIYQRRKNFYKLNILFDIPLLLAIPFEISLIYNSFYFLIGYLF